MSANYKEEDAPVDSNDNDEASVKQETKKEEDEEGLLVKGYEVVLCGTGLVQSILASALARAGLDILHCDAMPYYGEYDAVLTWDQFASTTTNACKSIASSTIVSNDDDASVLTLHSPTSMQMHSSSLQLPTTTRKVAEWKVGTELSTPYGPGRLVSLPSSFVPLKDSVVVELIEWKLANQTCPRVYFGANHNNHNISSFSELQQYLAQECGVVSMTTLYGEWLYQQRREVGFDVTPGLLFASGPAVDGLLASGVADYLEFKSMLGLYLVSSSSSTQELKRVPCSKADVFSTKLLPPADKRKFMKFLQLASDFSVQSLSMTESSSTTTELKGSDVDDPNAPQEGETGAKSHLDGDIVQSVNERHLKQGRSLSRPQNKAVATGHLTRLVELISLSKEQDSSNAGMENGDDNDDDDNMTLEAYLREEHKMSDKSENLRHMIVHALALGDATASLSDSMTVLSRHLQSLGRFGGTAFLAPLYGSGELSQAFCRSAAVHGGTYLLRRAPKQILFDSSSTTNGVSGILLGGSERDDNDEHETNASKDKIIKCQHVVVPAESIPLEEQQEHDVSSKFRVLRRISILRGKLIVDETSGDTEQRYIAIIPPNSGNIQNTHVIHGISLDDSVHVVPDLNHYKNMGGCTMLHLTTIIEESSSDDTTTSNDSSHGDVLERALESILLGQTKQHGSHSSNINAASSVVPLEELHHVSFSYAVPSSSCLLLNKCKGLHVCQRPIQSITVDGAFDEARRIFESIVPGAKFLVRSEELDKAVKERIGNHQGYDSDDDEGMVLESAMNMIGSKTTTRTTTTATTTSDHDLESSAVELPPKSDPDTD